MPTFSNNLRAFTLIEVLVVVAIIGIAGAVVVPNMIDPGSLTIQSASRHVIADLLFAQNDAMAHQKIRRVVFDDQNDRYHVAIADGSVMGVKWMGGDAAAGNYQVDFRGDKRFSGVTLENPDFGGDSTLEFDVLGGPDSGGSVDVVHGNFRYRITVAPMTGRVTIVPVTGG